MLHVFDRFFLRTSQECRISVGRSASSSRAPLFGMAAPGWCTIMQEVGRSDQFHRLRRNGEQHSGCIGTTAPMRKKSKPIRRKERENRCRSHSKGRSPCGAFLRASEKGCSEKLVKASAIEMVCALTFQNRRLFQTGADIKRRY